MKFSKLLIIVSILVCLFANPYAVVLAYAIAGKASMWQLLMAVIGNVVINYVLYRELSVRGVTGFVPELKYVLIPYSIALLVPIAEIGYIVANMGISSMLYGAPRPEEIQILSTTATYTALAYIAYILATTTRRQVVMKLRGGR